MALYRCGGGEQTTDITPSNSSPAAMTSGTAYKAQGNGYAIESYSSLAPSDAGPAAIEQGKIYRATTAGKAVSSITTVTPTTSGATINKDYVYKFSSNCRATIGQTLPMYRTSKLVKNTSDTSFAYDSNYVYLIISTRRINGTTPLSNSWRFVNGSLYQLQNNTNASVELVNGYFELTGDNASYTTEFTIFQITTL